MLIYRMRILIYRSAWVSGMSELLWQANAAHGWGVAPVEKISWLVKSRGVVEPWQTTYLALPWAFRPCDNLSLLFLQQSLGAEAERIVVRNADEMPLFQFLTERCRSQRAKYRNGYLMIRDLELARPIFSTCGSLTDGVPIVLETLAKKPKQYPPRRRQVILGENPLRIGVPANQCCKLTFALSLSGRELGSATVARPWACDVEILSAQLGCNMGLYFGSLDDGQSFQHISQLRLSWKEQANDGQPSAITVLCAQKALVNMTPFLARSVTARGYIVTRCGWRRPYNEFAALAESAMVQQMFPAKLTQVVLQAYAQDCRVKEGRAPRRGGNWKGCYHALITSRLADTEKQAVKLVQQWCDVHPHLLSDLATEIDECWPSCSTYFA